MNDDVMAGMLQELGDVVGAAGVVTVWCPGRPRTKGSLKPLHIRKGNGRCSVSLTESGEYAIAWKAEMIMAIRETARCERWPGPVRVDTTFAFQRLCLPDMGMPWPIRASGTWAHGDEDKLRRNALDALTQSGLILDDALVLGGGNLKRWVDQPGYPPMEGPGALIVVSPVGPSVSLTAPEGGLQG